MRLYDFGWFSFAFCVTLSCGSRIENSTAFLSKDIPTKIDFNYHVRPILSDRCFTCHGPDENAREGDLRLDREENLSRAALSGLAYVEPGHPGRSEVISRILHEDPELVMPPVESQLSLTEREKAILTKWVKDGAEWKDHWAYLKPEKTSIGSSEIDPIDHFIQEKLAREGLSPSQQADSKTRARRVSIDLIGLPLSLEEMAVFVGDTSDDASDDAYERLVDRLLASKHFGERWAWHWLDIARYADTNGFQGDPTRKMWPWRDWVIQAFNDNMPYDQFTVEQLAGDLLPNATQDQILATAFNRNHMYNGEGGRIPEETRVENVFDRLETMGTTWLGLTLNCCRCHDHKFDDISQKEYYQFFDFFNQTTEGGGGRNGRVPPVLDLSGPIAQAEVADIKAMLDNAAAELYTFEEEKFPRESGPASESEETIGLNGHEVYALSLYPTKRESYLQGLLIRTFKEKDPPYTDVLTRMRKATQEYEKGTANNLQVMVMDHLEIPRPSYILNKGIYNSKEEQVTANIPAALPSLGQSKIEDRLELARWLVHPEHPLTARVTVNRFWQELFGTGLVKTVEDFGVQGEKPSHPELLDWLAADFVESGWDVKRLLKNIVMSSTYQQSSAVTPALLEQDPENRLFARSSRHRMHSWMIRDQALALSGLLVDSIGGPSVKPYQPEGIWAEATFGKTKYAQDHGLDLYRKSLYIFWRRIVSPTMFFDNASRQTCSVKPSLTNTPLHALTTLNDVTFVEASRVWAQKLLKAQDGTPQNTITHAFQQAAGRTPEPTENQILSDRYFDLLEEYNASPSAAKALLAMGEYPLDVSLDPPHLAAMTNICNMILNLDEVISKQ